MRQTTGENIEHTLNVSEWAYNHGIFVGFILGVGVTLIAVSVLGAFL